MRCTVLAIVLGVAAAASLAPAQTSSAFTYQGRVTNNGVPMNGTATIQLSLWKDAFSGNVADRVGNVQTLNNVSVTNGVFTVVANSLLEFGLNPFNGEARWLQVAVDGQSLLPRQQILSTPYASGLTGGGGAINNSSGTTTFSFTNLSTNTSSGGANTIAIRRGNASGISLAGYYPAALSVDTANVNGVVSTSSASGAFSIFGLSSGDSGTGVTGQASGPNAYGVLGLSTATGTSGVRGIANGNSGNGVHGTSSGSFGAGLYGVASGPNGLGVLAAASGTDGRAISATISGAATHAGYFNGQVYVANRLGIGVVSPTVPLDVQVALNQSIQFRLDSIVPGINVNTSGGNSGILRLRNALEIWPNDAGTKAGRLDVRNAAGAPVIILDGASGNINATGTITPSSSRLKEHVTPMHDALERLLRLEGVRFDWIEEEAAKRGGKTHDLGFIAESIAKEFPEVVARDAQGQVIGVDYARMSAVAVQAIKQQNARIEALATENADLKARLQRLEAHLKP